MIHRLAAHISYFGAQCSLIGNYSFCESRNDGHLANGLKFASVLATEIVFGSKLKKNGCSCLTGVFVIYLEYTFNVSRDRSVEWLDDTQVTHYLTLI